MTKQDDFKRRVRARMAKTGESYTAARSQLLADQSATAGSPTVAGGGSSAAPSAAPSAAALSAAALSAAAREWLAAALHVSNGDATDLPGTGLTPRVLYWRDVLHEGPVPEVDDERLRRIRADFLADANVDDRGEGPAMFAERDRTLAANRDGEYVLWFEADLYDQLQIIQILSRLAGLGVPAERISLICIGEHAGFARFGGLGQLSAAQLRELPATNACARLTPAALDLATRAWAAFRAPTPVGLGAIAADRSAELRFLGEAFDRLSREYPATRDGLSLTERRVLAAVADGAADAGTAPGALDAGTAFVRAAARENRPYLGDSWCFAMMARMARAPVPLLSLPGASADQPVDRLTHVRLTDAGARVLAGAADHVALNGIDRWIGGVHLHGSHARWRWDDGPETITGPFTEAGALSGSGGRGQRTR